MATLYLRNQKPKKITNLGWILRNWKQVKSLGFNCFPFENSQFCARLENGGCYITDFADFSIAFNWVNRPVFKGLEFRIREYDDCLNGSFYSFVIGDEKYKEICRINNRPGNNHKEFLAAVFNSSNLSKEQRSI